MKIEDTEALGRYRARKMPDIVDRPVRTIRPTSQVVLNN